MGWVDMRRLRVGTLLGLVLALALGLGLVARSFGRVAGGGPPATDCYIELDGVDSTTNRVECTDCDPGCDRDGVTQPNGSCTFRVAACLNQPGIAACTPTALKKAKVSPKKLGIEVPSDLSGGSVCGAFTDVVVKAKKKRKLRLFAKAAGKPAKKDVDTIVLLCKPQQGACPTTTTTTTQPRISTTTLVSATTTTKPPTTTTKPSTTTTGPSTTSTISLATTTTVGGTTTTGAATTTTGTATTTTPTTTTITTTT